MTDDQHEILEYIAGMREKLDEAESRIRRGQLYTTFKSFLVLKRLAYGAASRLSNTTTKAAREWGHL